ncbi:hypothetical protein [Streptomyces sp. UG1]|uniref:hypothetical protein n=1 Tax=Streptomyces sp. UG1 TaxID=3417652 RepID=UPI003CE826CB
MGRTTGTLTDRAGLRCPSCGVGGFLGADSSPPGNALNPAREDHAQTRGIFIQRLQGRLTLLLSYSSDVRDYFAGEQWKGNLLTFTYYKDSKNCSYKYPGNRYNSTKENGKKADVVTLGTPHAGIKKSRVAGCGEATQCDWTVTESSGIAGTANHEVQYKAGINHGQLITKDSGKHYGRIKYSTTWTTWHRRIHPVRQAYLAVYWHATT